MLVECTPVLYAGQCILLCKFRDQPGFQERSPRQMLEMTGGDGERDQSKEQERAGTQCHGLGQMQQKGTGDKGYDRQGADEQRGTESKAKKKEGADQDDRQG